MSFTWGDLLNLYNTLGRYYHHSHFIENKWKNRLVCPLSSYESQLIFGRLWIWTWKVWVQSCVSNSNVVLLKLPEEHKPLTLNCTLHGHWFLTHRNWLKNHTDFLLVFPVYYCVLLHRAGYLEHTGTNRFLLGLKSEGEKNCYFRAMEIQQGLFWEMSTDVLGWIFWLLGGLHDWMVVYPMWWE